MSLLVIKLKKVRVEPRAEFAGTGNGGQAPLPIPLGGRLILCSILCLP